MKVGTHNGLFHADDVFACAILSTSSDTVLELKRTRDPEVLAECDVVFDVGGVFDAGTERYDHHQKGGAGKRGNGVPYSSAGLVWGEYWPAALRAAMPMLGFEEQDEVFLIELSAEVDRKLIQGIDAADCGHSLFINLAGDEGVYTDPGAKPMSISSVISAFNPTWLETVESDQAFMLAVQVAKTVLLRTIASSCAEMLAKDEFLKVCAESVGDGIAVLDRFLPWAHSIQVPDGIEFVVFPATTGDQWMVQCVPPYPGSFEQRKPLPASWAGLRDSDLAELTQVDDAIFCHIGRFIGGARSREGALDLAHQAVDA
jgi:uncharacterized UPF0160 family protein